MSPVLFSLFLNDLSELISRAYNGLNNVSDMAHILLSNDEIEVYFKLYILLYADDTVIALNAMFLDCKSWDLEVNPTKIKITIFCNRKSEHVPKTLYNGQELSVDDSFIYLGAMFSNNGHFTRNSQRLFDQARKAMFSVLKKSRKLQLPMDIKLQMFDTMVLPILLYGSEVTGFENHSILERLCLQFYKIILNVKKHSKFNLVWGTRKASGLN